MKAIASSASLTVGRSAPRWLFQPGSATPRLVAADLLSGTASLPASWSGTVSSGTSPEPQALAERGSCRETSSPSSPALLDDGEAGLLLNDALAGLLMARDHHEPRRVLPHLLVPPRA